MTRRNTLLLIGLALTAVTMARTAEAQFRLGRFGIGGGSIRGGSNGGVQPIPQFHRATPIPHQTLPFVPKQQPRLIPNQNGQWKGILPGKSKTSPLLPAPSPKAFPRGIGGLADLFAPRTSPIPPGVTPLPFPAPDVTPPNEGPPLITIPGIVRPPFVCPGGPAPPLVSPIVGPPLVTPIVGPPLVTPPLVTPPVTGLAGPGRTSGRPANPATKEASTVDLDESFADDVVGARSKAKQGKLERVAKSAKQALRNEDYDQALQLANRMVQTAPKHGGALQFRAAVYLGMAKYPEAAIDAYSALLVGPIWTMANIKDVYGSPQAYRRDVEWLSDTTTEKPEVLAHQFLSAYHGMVRNDLNTSEKHLNKMLEIKPEEPVALKLLERVGIQQGTAKHVAASPAK